MFLASPESVGELGLGRRVESTGSSAYRKELAGKTSETVTPDFPLLAKKNRRDSANPLAAIVGR